MTVFISADIEGCTGLLSWNQCGNPGEQYDWPHARRMMTHDVNAAVRGARAAGAERVLIKDSHGRSKNLLIEDLEPGVELISGHGSHPNGMMTGIDASFDCAMLVGYHAMAGTPLAIMEHTISGFVHRLWLNGRQGGEQALSGMVAGAAGVPIVCVTSDLAGCLEAEAWFPGVATAAVKEGIGRYMGRCLHPSETGPMIEEAARRGCSERATEPLVYDGPVTVRIEFNLTAEADIVGKLPGVARVDGYTVESTQPNASLAHQMARAMISTGAGGREANQ